MIDFIKLLVVGFGYGVIAPVAGYFVARERYLQDFICIMLMFMLGLHIDTTVLMVDSIEWYRGVTKGYEFSVMEVLAITLIFSCLFDPKRKFVFLPLGTIPWFIYVFFSSLSVFQAIEVSYVFMNILKFAKVWLIVYAIANYVRSRREVQVILIGLSIMLIYEFLVVMKMKFIDGFYQVRGTFEHQNPLAIFTYMAALPILAAAMSDRVKQKLSIFYLFTFACSGIIVYATLSRAALAVMALGIVAVVISGFFDHFSKRKFFVTVCICTGGLFVLLMTVDTIMARFADHGNQASEQTRQVMNLAAKAMMDDKVVGVGWNNFAIAVNYPFPYGEVIDDWNRDRGHKVDDDYAKGVVESHYWLIKSENGILAYYAYMFFILYTLLRGVHIIFLRRGTFAAAIMAGIFIAFSLAYLHSNLERVLTQTKNLMLWMIYLGVIGAIIRIPKEEFEHETEGEA